jgi:hypothetical protein
LEIGRASSKLLEAYSILDGDRLSRARDRILSSVEEAQKASFDTNLMQWLALKQLTGFRRFDGPKLRPKGRNRVLKLGRTSRNTQNGKAPERVNHADWRRSLWAPGSDFLNWRAADKLSFDVEKTINQFSQSFDDVALIRLI